MKSQDRFIVVGSKPWNRQVFDEELSQLKGSWIFVSDRDELSYEKLKTFNPRFVFFLHWSWKVPAEIVRDFECIGFHMTDLPYGRGGTPLQNLILSGKSETKLSSFRFSEDLDAGPIYMKKVLSLKGSAEEIYIRSSYLSAEMIEKMIETSVGPNPQTGQPVVFRRRKPHESEIQHLADLLELYNFIRMVDAQTYPRAYLNYQGFRFEFKGAELGDDVIQATVTIKMVEEE